MGWSIGLFIKGGYATPPDPFGSNEELPAVEVSCESMAPWSGLVAFEVAGRGCVVCATGARYSDMR